MGHLVNLDSSTKLKEEQEFGDDEDEFVDEPTQEKINDIDDLSDLPLSQHEPDSHCNIYGIYKQHKFNKQKMMNVTIENIILSMNEYKMCFKDVRIFAH